jgi:hypothetical protein
LNTSNTLPTMHRNHPSDIRTRLHLKTKPLGTAQFKNFIDDRKT